MKKLFKKHGFILILWLIIILIFVFGGMYSRYVSNSLQDESVQSQNITLVVPDAHSVRGGN